MSDGFQSARVINNMKRDEGREHRSTRAAAELAKLGGTRKEARTAEAFASAAAGDETSAILLGNHITTLGWCASQARISMSKRVSSTASPQQNKRRESQAPPRNSYRAGSSYVVGGTGLGDEEKKNPRVTGRR
jgi:hypothetical protein